MSELDDVAPAAVESLPYRTPLEDSLLGMTTAMSCGGQRRGAARVPNTPWTSAVTYAELIKALVEHHPFEHGRVTASLGVASLPDSVAVPDELLGGAYTSVADAKRRGGNRVAVL